jgi:small subunit ribosomal protein S17
MKNKGIGLDVPRPAKECSDKNCPFHGELTVRGRALTGIVTSDKMSKTVSVGWTRRIYVPKFERYEKRRSKVKAHNPECLNAKKGDFVKIMECKPLAKTKHFVIVQIVGGQSKEEAVKAELLQESLAETVLAEKPKQATADDKDKKKTKSESE